MTTNIRREQLLQEDVGRKVVGSNPGAGKEIFHQVSDKCFLLTLKYFI